MRFNVTVTFRFNKELKTIDLNPARELLLQGVRQEEDGAKIIGHEIKDNELIVRLTTGDQVRGPEAILRLKNYLAKRLGKEHYGVRGLNAEIEVILDQEAPDILGVKTQGNKLYFKLDETGLRQRVIANALKQVKTETVGVGFGHLIKRGPKREMYFDKDPAQYFEEQGYAIKYPGRGQWIFTDKMMKLLRVFEKLILERVVKPLGFNEWLFPRLVPLEVMAKMPNYLGHLPEGMFYVTAGGRDPQQFKEFATDFTLTQVPNKELLKKALPAPRYVLDPAQCTNFYQAFAGKKVEPKILPIKVFERGGWTWRNEGGACCGLERTNEFIRFEIVYMGYPTQVKKLRRELYERTLDLVDKVFELEWKVVIGAPFYVTDRKVRVDIKDPDMVETYDLEAYLPYRGDRDAEWLEINAFNMHGGKNGDPFAKTFVLKDARGERLWTGCTGFGVTRWITAFLAQKGFDTNNWPELIRQMYEGA